MRSEQALTVLDPEPVALSIDIQNLNLLLQPAGDHRGDDRVAPLAEAIERHQFRKSSIGV